MKKIALGDVGVGTLNIGTEIIMHLTKKFFFNYFKENTVITFPTHTPAFHWYQLKGPLANYCKNADYKIIPGTNLLKMNGFLRNPLWNINLFNYEPLKNVILCGIGRGGNGFRPNGYTRTLYKKVLSKEYTHSTRDNKTKDILNVMGFKAINTGCITLWGLTSEFCKTIKTKKARNVIFSLNGVSRGENGKPDKKIDCQLIELLKEKYETIYYWYQTIGDLDYLKNISDLNRIKIIYNNVSAFEYILQNCDVDYIGCRLHGGIFAMNNKVRSIILSIDYRSREMAESFNINLIEEKDISTIKNKIDSEFATNINIDNNAIETFCNQFENFYCIDKK
jgi:polysaccharide pyruvyl transferase WcaK-like protein